MEDDIEFCFLLEAFIWHLKDEKLLQDLKNNFYESYSGYPVEIRLLYHIAKEWGITSYFESIIEIPKIILSNIKCVFKSIRLIDI